MLTVVLFLGSAAAIYFACEFFVNGVEWLGRKLGVGETATGTILAAFGTALPESAAPALLHVARAARKVRSLPGVYPPEPILWHLKYLSARPISHVATKLCGQRPAHRR